MLVMKSPAEPLSLDRARLLNATVGAVLSMVTLSALLSVLLSEPVA